ncbi:MAG: DUF3500 domain-containing protein [Nocardioides sp.]|uniref:DUF3500 domain-containing protein n=1 Tax=Nocardioides sp. TaxID=35761 RepID=UPI0039E39E2C
MPTSRIPALSAGRRTRCQVMAASAVGLIGLGLVTACGSSSDTDASDGSSSGSVSATAGSGMPSGAMPSGSGMPSGAAPSGSGAPSGGGVGGGDTDCSDAGTPTAAASGAVPENDDADEVASVVKSANAFLDTLSSSEKSSVSNDYTDLATKECTWSNFPDGLFNGRNGLRMGDLTNAQVKAAKKVVETAMSSAGYTYVTEQLNADDQLSSGDDDTTYGQQNYHIAFYGDPSTDSAWSLQFGGHHLGIMVSIGGDTLSLSPYFKGTQPVSYTYEGKTVEAMGDLSDDFFSIFTSMDDDAQSAAELDGEYTDLVMGPQNDTGYPDTEGTAYGDLTTAEQKLVKSVIEGYVADYAGALSDPLVSLYESQLDDTYVAWATGLDTDDNAYLRIDGPRLWIEWVNTDNPGESGIHYHTIYRDKELDYGTGTGDSSSSSSSGS